MNQPTSDRVTILPIETMPQGEDALEPAEIETQEGAWALVIGTNGKAAGWVDTHALFGHQLYCDQILPRPASIVRVKRIDWDRESNGTLAGRTIAGIYRIVGAINGGHAVSLGSRVLRTADGRTNFPSEQDARAAAQSDLETLIASALERDSQVETSHALSENDIIRACAEVAVRTIAKLRWRK